MKIDRLFQAGRRARALRCSCTLLTPLLAAGAAVLAAFTVTSAHADTLYVDFATNTIVTYNTAGGSPTTFANTGLSNPNGLKVDSSGNVYVANGESNQANVEKFTPAGVGSPFANPGLNNPLDLAFDASGNLFVSCNAGANIEKITPGGVATPFATLSSFGQMLAFDSKGDLFVVVGNNTIDKFASTAGVLSNMPTVFTSTGVSGYGLAFDSAGNLYAEDGPGIEEFKSTAGVLSNVGTVFASTGLNGATGMAFDSANNLYVANRGNDTIEKYTPAGVTSTFATTTSAPYFLTVATPEPASTALLCGSGAWLLLRRRAKKLV